MARIRLRARAAAALMVLLAFPACTTWRASEAAPRVVIPGETPEAVRVTLGSGATATIQEPMLRNDSIVSHRLDEPAVPVSEVTRLEVRSFSAARTLGAAAAGAVAAALWTVAMAGSGGEVDVPGPIPKLASEMLRGLTSLGRLIPVP